MKKFISVILCFCLVGATLVAFSGCSKVEDLKYDVVLITDGGDIHDGGYNESAWNGINEYINDNSLSATYYQPTLTKDENDNDVPVTVEQTAQYVKLAVEKGAQYVVFSGEDFAVASYEIAPQYPDVKFILVDAMPHADSTSTLSLVQNVMSINFDSLQSGYLAGYTAVIEGNTKLGYLGSVTTDSDSSNYGAGFVQGAAAAADELKTPVTLQYADYNTPILNYDYSLTVKAVYDKVENANKDCYKVVVENGYGSGTYKDGQNVTIYCDEYNADGQKFDHWEKKSNTDGVKDKKVNVSSTKKTEINLIVADCDCTLTAVYADTDEKISSVDVLSTDGSVYKTYVGEVDNTVWISAPVAENGMKFDHWETNASSDTIESPNNKETNVTLTDSKATLTPIYVISSEPTFNLTVEGGSGSGAYLSGDSVHVIADLPQDGYYFEKWTNVDATGNGTGIAMDNEFYYDTTFDMVDRYASIAEEMFDKGVTVMFAGGCETSSSLFTAKDTFDSDKIAVISAGKTEKGDYTCTKKEYGTAIKACLTEFKGGSLYGANCSNNSISMTYVAEEKDKDTLALYDNMYKALSDGTVTPVEVAPGADVRLSYSSKCLSLNYWINVE